MYEQRIIEGQRFGVYGNCVINTWGSTVRREHLVAFDEMIGQVVPRYPEGIAFFVVVEPGCPLLDGDMRKEVEAVYSRWASSMRAVAQVVEGGNLWSVTARSLMAAIRLVQRRPYPMKVFAVVSEGVQWVAPYVAKPENETAADAGQGLLASIERLRAMRATG